MYVEHNQSAPSPFPNQGTSHTFLASSSPTKTLLTEITFCESLHNIRHVNASIHSLLKRHTEAFGTPPYFRDGRVKQLDRTVQSEFVGEVKIKTDRGKRYYFLKNNIYGLIIFLRIYDLSSGSIIGILPEFTYLDVPTALRNWYNEKASYGNKKRFHIRQATIKALEKELDWS